MTDIAAAYRIAFETDAGHVVLLDMIRRYHVSVPVHQPGQPDMTAFFDGQRSVVLDILDVVRRSRALEEVVEESSNEALRDETPTVEQRDGL